MAMMPQARRAAPRSQSEPRTRVLAIATPTAHRSSASIPSTYTRSGPGRVHTCHRRMLRTARSNPSDTGLSGRSAATYSPSDDWSGSLHRVTGGKYLMSHRHRELAQLSRLAAQLPVRSVQPEYAASHPPHQPPEGDSHARRMGLITSHSPRTSYHGSQGGQPCASNGADHQLLPHASHPREASHARRMGLITSHSPHTSYHGSQGGQPCASNGADHQLLPHASHPKETAMRVEWG